MPINKREVVTSLLVGAIDIGIEEGEARALIAPIMGQSVKNIYRTVATVGAVVGSYVVKKEKTKAVLGDVLASSIPLFEKTVWAWVKPLIGAPHIATRGMGNLALRGAYTQRPGEQIQATTPALF